MAGDFVGRGWAFPIMPDASGMLRYSEGDENIEKSLQVLLLTRLRERRMRPKLGTEVEDLVFAPGSRAVLSRLERMVRDAVRDWEPRVELLEVRPELDPDDETRAIVSIDYRVRRTQNRFSLVFPYYLQGTG